MTTVTLDRLGFRYKEGRDYVLRAVSVSVDGPMFIGLLGENGSGKSTLGRLICGHLRPSEGRIGIRGVEPHSLKCQARARLAQFVHQDTSFGFVTHSVQSEMALAANIAGLSVSEDGQAELFCLPADTSVSPFGLDANQQWRLALLLACMYSPPILFIDEIPSMSSLANRYVLRSVVEARRANGYMTFLSMQRELECGVDARWRIDGRRLYND